MEQGGTVILTSHEMAELSLCHRIYVLKEGRLAEIPAAETAAQLMGYFS